MYYGRTRNYLNVVIILLRNIKHNLYDHASNFSKLQDWNSFGILKLLDL
jgi:hypothetical protein